MILKKMIKLFQQQKNISNHNYLDVFIQRKLRHDCVNIFSYNKTISKEKINCGMCDIVFITVK